MGQVARRQASGDRLGRVSEQSAWDGPPAIGRRQQQHPEAARLAVFERTDIRRLPGLRMLDPGQALIKNAAGS